MNCVPLNARIVQEQDGAAPTAQMAVQTRPPRSIPKSLVVESVVPSAVRGMITEFHYLHSMPAASRRCYGVFHDSALVGAVVFTAGARRGHNVLAASQPQEVATLARLWLTDELPKNAESRVIGAVLRHLRRNTDWKLLLSYADPSAGHIGTIYQATGWLYLGQGGAEGYLELADGQIIHPRTAYKRYGSTAVGHLARTGVPARRSRMPAKHRYAYVLDQAWRWRFRGVGLPYPKRSTAEATP